MAITDPNKIALADTTGGNANGKNGLKLAQLQTAKVLDRSSTSINEMFSRVVNTVGVQTQHQVGRHGAGQPDHAEAGRAAGNVSGVNLNEEYVSLSQYQEQYQASARIIDVASTMFDTLLGLRG